MSAVGLPLEHALEDGWTLPASWYSDGGVQALERERIFAGAWQYAGAAERFAAPGSFLASLAGQVTVVLTRDATDELHGHLDARPLTTPVSVDTWGPFVFVNPDRDAAPLREALADVAELLATSGVRLDELRFHSHWELELAANWKVALENYLECYHCPVAHPGFSKVIDVDPDAYGLVLGRGSASQLGPVRASALAGDAPYDARGDVRQAQYHFLWPNTTINVDPGPQNLSIERWVPAGLGKTIEVTDYFFGPDAADEQIDELIAFGSQVAKEDVALVEGVQRGLDSRAVPQGRILRESEKLVADFQRRVYVAVAGG